MCSIPPPPTPPVFQSMGIPFRKFICASNENNVLTEFIQTGCYDLRHRHLHVTMAPAIDILKSSNLERYVLAKVVTVT